MNFYSTSILQLADFYQIMDVRSPAEYAEDHIPGAFNCPVLNDQERAQVGTLYKSSPFEARKLGAALISANMAKLLQTEFCHHDKSWRPLIYCARGGKRSGAATLILSQVGWSVQRLDGGYKSYRKLVLNQLESLPQSLHFIVLCGPTGSGKSRLLHALQRAGEQVLDLEALAQHRGSTFGLLPGITQPRQRRFESLLWQQLSSFSSQRPVFIEAESRRIGALSLPDGLLRQMYCGTCVQLNVPLAERVRFLEEDYAFYRQEPESLAQLLLRLQSLHSRQKIQHWQELIQRRQFDELVVQLLTIHYDPLYWRSMRKHYPQLAKFEALSLSQLNDFTLDQAALQIRKNFKLL